MPKQYPSVLHVKRWIQLFSTVYPVMAYFIGSRLYSHSPQSARSFVSLVILFMLPVLFYTEIQWTYKAVVFVRELPVKQRVFAVIIGVLPLSFLLLPTTPAAEIDGCYLIIPLFAAINFGLNDSFFSRHGKSRW